MNKTLKKWKNKQRRSTRKRKINQFVKEEQMLAKALNEGRITAKFYGERKKWHEAQIEEEDSIEISEEDDYQMVQNKSIKT